MSEQEDLAYYLALPYTIEVVREDGDTWFGRVAELPGCITEGDSPEDAIRMALDAMRSWIAIALADGRSVPEPRPAEEYSGKFVVRVPKSLHRKLAQEAEAEGVSLNQYVNVALAAAVGQAAGEGRRPQPQFED